MHTAYVSVRLGLLALLDRADMYGYQLKAQFEAQTGGIWPLNIGQVYTTLERLERDGLVAVATGLAAGPHPEGGPGDHPPGGPDADPTGAGARGGDGRGATATRQPTRVGGREQKYYAITPAGRNALAGWYATSPTDMPPPRDELVAKVLFALAGGRDHALAVITRQRTALTAALQARHKQRRALAGQRARGTAAEPPPDGAAALSTQLVTDALIARAEADLRWLDLCEARVTRLAAGPAGRAETPH
jgi:DNA-binding PadR family transcriptional regulator